MNDEAKTIAETPHALGAEATSPDASSSSAAMPASVAAPPSSPSDALPASGASIGGSLAASVVMHSEETARARAFYRAAAVMSAATAAFMPLVPGPIFVRMLTMALCVVASGLGVYSSWALRDERKYTWKLVTVLGVIYALIGELALFYFGLFTAGAMILPLGVYFFGLSESPIAARTTYVVGAVLYLFLSLGVVIGFLPDLGPLPVRMLPAAWRWFFLVMTQVVFAATFLLARSSRRATELAILRVERAVKQIQQRDALLAEARGEIDRVMRPGEGRYTGETIGGYKLGDVLGRGGMGEVYAAQHEARGERAAIKLLHPSILGDSSQVKRFLREAEIAQKVSSPFIARVLSAGLAPSGTPFVAMELLSGHDLAWHLRKSTRMPLKKVTQLVEHASMALVAIREAGIVHRDLKPHNLLFCDDLRVWKVLDFGVSRYESGGTTITQGAALVGTPSYMAPEQVRLEKVDHRADLYALANVVYRALTGKPAFVGDDLAGVLFHVVHTAPPQPSAHARIPVDVELVLAIAMAKSRDDRFQKIEEFADAFKKAAKGELDVETRDRALRIVAKHPWSTPDTRATA